MDGEQTSKGGGSGKWIAACCGCLLLLAVLAGGAVAFGVMKVKGAIDAYDAEATAFLAAAEGGDIEGAYGRFSGPLKQAQSLDDFRAGVQGNPDLFAAQDVSFNSIQTDGTTGVTTLKGTVTSKSGKVRHCVFGWVEEGGQKKLMEYRISDNPL